MANWIAGAIQHPGALTAQANKAGMSPMAFAHAHDEDAGTTGRRARLAETLQGFHHGGGGQQGGGGQDDRTRQRAAVHDRIMQRFGAR